MKVFISLKVPRGDATLEILARLTTELVVGAGHLPFVATYEIAKNELIHPKDFMPFVRQHAETSNLMIVHYHPELRGGLIEMGLAYANDIPIWLCYKSGQRVSSSALGCADLILEYNNLEELKTKLTANLANLGEF